MRIPVSTYRVQFNRDFRFSDALQIVEYLHQLGITDLYASPIFKARAGSTHGYDVVDPTQLNAEIGTPEEFNALCQALQARDMGLILDIIPNHMAATPDNPWWFDVLEKGEDSEYARLFDVNWETKQVLLPILAKPFGEVLDNHEITLTVEDGRRLLRYHEHRLPIAAGAEDLAVAGIDQVLSRQHYRLAHWRKAADGINYRRFFDISDLIGLRAERSEVFQRTHAYVLKLVEEHQVTGLRIDHIDGLLDPKGYLDRLPNIYVVAEKILTGNEHLPREWRTHGTTGYDFLNSVNGPFIDPEGFHQLERIYADHTGSWKTVADVFRECKRRIMNELFSGELKTMVRDLARLAESDRHARDLWIEDLKEALVAVTACLRVYRTYIRDEQISETDRAYIEDAVSAAGSGTAFDFLRRVLLVNPAWYLQDQKNDYLNFVMRWQQFTGPIMAKGLEDTAFYLHNPLISTNEVGGDCNGPEIFLGVEGFHRRNLARQEQWPHAMNASSTHDAKRSEDVRARINVLTEITHEWERRLRAWTGLNPSTTAPDAKEQILIYQSMLGAWPIEVDRLKQYATKALREGKAHTQWIDIQENYERSVLSFVDALYSNEAFLRDFSWLQKKLAYFGALSSLAQLVLKITSPGIPDFYRGTEIWDLSLADPDNRRAIDFPLRTAMFEQLKKRPNVRSLLKHWSDGRLKMFVTWTLLNFRRERRQLFLDGDYIPLQVTGPRSDHVIAFARRLLDEWCIVAVPRLCASLTRVGTPPIGEKVWLDTKLEMPSGMPERGKDVFTNKETSTSLVSDLFASLPFAVVHA